MITARDLWLESAKPANLNIQHIHAMRLVLQGMRHAILGTSGLYRERGSGLWSVVHLYGITATAYTPMVTGRRHVVTLNSNLPVESLSDRYECLRTEEDLCNTSTR